MTTKRKIAVAACAGIVFIVGLCVWWLVRFNYEWSKPTKYVAQGSIGHQAVFLKHGALMGYKISLFVLPKGQADLVWVGTVDSDDALMFRDACWSVDGSVVACRAALIVYNRAPTNVLDSTVFTHTYDFRNGQPIVAPKDDTDEETGWDARNQKIEALLQERGGKAPPLSGDSTTWTRVPYFEWRAFEKLEKVGR